MSNVDELIKNAEHAYYKENNYSKVIELLTEASNIDPTNIKIFDFLGVVLFDIGEFDDALTTYNTILKLDSDNGNAKLKKAQIFTELKRYDEALTILDNLIDNDNKKDEALVAKLQLYVEKGDEDGYQKTLNSCEEIINNGASKELIEEIEFIKSVYSIINQ